MTDPWRRKELACDLLLMLEYGGLARWTRVYSRKAVEEPIK